MYITVERGVVEVPYVEERLTSLISLRYTLLHSTLHFTLHPYIYTIGTRYLSSGMNAVTRDYTSFYYITSLSTTFMPFIDTAGPQKAD